MKKYLMKTKPGLLITSKSKEQIDFSFSKEHRKFFENHFGKLISGFTQSLSKQTITYTAILTKKPLQEHEYRDLKESLSTYFNVVEA